jgi:hypothetical protein
VRIRPHPRPPRLNRRTPMLRSRRPNPPGLPRSRRRRPRRSTPRPNTRS